MMSLVVATWDRVGELERLLASLDRQTYRDIEVIVVDQNSDERLDSVLRSHPALKIRRLRSERGVSKARNLGLHMAEGDIVAFPDDDCWYPPELLQAVKDWFEQHPQYAVLLTAMRDDRGRSMAPKFGFRGGKCTKRTILQCAMMTNAFLRTEAAQAVRSFREDIGPGTSSPYQSGEDLEYLIRAVRSGLPVWYEPALSVFHPYIGDRGRLLRTTYAYALGVGFVLRLHDYSWAVLVGCVARSLCRAAIQLCKSDREGARIYALRAKGQFRGYAFPPTNGVNPTPGPG